MTQRSSRSMPQNGRALTTAVIAASAGMAASSPAFAIAEAISTICREVGQTVVCEWYRGVGGHPLGVGSLPPADQVLTGSRTIVGFINGLFPQSTHEAFDDGQGGSRILAEIQAGAIPGVGATPTPMTHVELRTRASGVVGAAIGDGTPKTPTPLARGVAYTANAYVASVANFVGSAASFSPNEQGIYAAMLTMCDPVTQSNIPGGGLSGLADTIVFGYSVVGDWEGEGFTARVCDSIASTFGVTIVAPTGDGGAGPFPPQQPELAFRTVGSPASAFNVISVGGQESAELIAALSGPGGADGGVGGPGGAFFFEYNNLWTQSGRGRGDTRLWRQRDLNQPSGFAVERDSRVNVDIIAPAMALRLPTAEGDAVYSRAERVPDPPTATEVGSQSTAFAAGFVGGACALVQDAFKALRDGRPDLFPQFQGAPRLHNVAMRAILMNATEKSQLWTNQGNQGSGNAQRELFTQQALDTAEGAGRLDLHNLFRQFQGRIESGLLAAQQATMDLAETPITTPLIRDPASVGNPSGVATGGFDPPFGIGGGGGDPPLSGGLPGGPLPSGPFGGNPDERPRPSDDPRIPRPPGEQRVFTALPILPVGWDVGRLGLGFLDYELISPFVGGRDRFTATLVWNRLERFNIPNIFAGQTLNIATAETALELENLEMEFWLSDGSGTPGLRFAASEARRQNVEHIFIEQGVPAGSRAIVRIRWNGQIYDVKGGEPFSDVVYGLAWRLDDNPVPNLPGQNVVFLPGDLTGDGEVNFQDLGNVLRYLGSTNPAGDANGDGIVNFEDLNIVLSNFGRTLPAPGSPGQA